MITIDNLVVQFGGVKPINELSAVLTAPVAGLIGPNGAGKTTLLNVLSGFIRPVQGTVSLGAQALLPMTPLQRVRAGLRRSFQTEQVVGDLTVAGNIAAIADHGDVARRIRPGEQPGNRGENDDIALVLDQIGEGFAGADEGGVQIEPNREIPGLVRHADRRPDAVAAGIGNQDIEPAESLDDRFERFPHRNAIGRVGGDDGGADLIGNGAKRFGAPSDEHDVAAFPTDAPRDGGADARAAAGDQRCLLAETHISSSWTFRSSWSKGREASCPAVQSVLTERAKRC